MHDTNPIPYCTCNKYSCNLTQKILTREQDLRLTQFMMKLNDIFSTVRGNILMTQPLPKVSQAYRIFAQEERHRELTQQSVNKESLAFVVDRNNRFKPPYQSYSSGTKPPVAGNKRPGSYYYCAHCKVPGHSLERCFKLNGYPPGYKPKEKRFAATIQFNYEDSTTDSKLNTIYVDQYNHLLSLLNNQPSVSPSADTVAGPTTGADDIILHLVMP